MADLTPAEELREAAKRLRELADGATPGPWRHLCLGSEGCTVIRESGTVRERVRGRVARFGWKDWKADHADALFVAAMHPGIALALADWLDSFEARQAFGEYDMTDWNAALAVARAYLNGGGSAQD